MDWNRTLLTTGRCIDDPEWWRCIQMHWDAFVTAWREIWCRASSPWPLLRLPKLISTTPWIPYIAKTDIHSTQCFCRCSPKFGCNAFVKARFVAIHIAWILNIFTQRSHYILLHILQNVSGAPAHPNICRIFATYHRHLTPRETPCWSLKALHSQRKYFETVNPTGG